VSKYNSKFSSVGMDLCKAVNGVTADDWRKAFQYLKGEEVLSERGMLIDVITERLVLQPPPKTVCKSLMYRRTHRKKSIFAAWLPIAVAAVICDEMLVIYF
jgi:hypothetical protein